MSISYSCGSGSVSGVTRRDGPQEGLETWESKYNRSTMITPVVTTSVAPLLPLLRVWSLEWVWVHESRTMGPLRHGNPELRGYTVLVPWTPNSMR